MLESEKNLVVFEKILLSSCSSSQKGGNDQYDQRITKARCHQWQPRKSKGVFLLPSLSTCETAGRNEIQHTQLQAQCLSGLFLIFYSPLGSVSRDESLWRWVGHARLIFFFFRFNSAGLGKAQATSGQCCCLQPFPALSAASQPTRSRGPPSPWSKKLGLALLIEMRTEPCPPHSLPAHKATFNLS